jgi:hypothetical protein
MSTEVTTTEERNAPARRDRAEVYDPVPILSTERFEHMQRIANVMLHSNLLPETLTHEGTKDRKTRLPDSTIAANAFLITNQAVRWGLDPFAVVSSCSVVHGRLSYEGKLVAGVLDAKLGIKLHQWFTGSGEAERVFVSDVPFSDEMVAALKPGIQIPGVRMLDGSVADWKTTGAGSPWTPKAYRRQLRYRGTREWARAFEPALLLGVYTEDEMRGLDARDVTPVAKRPSLASRLNGTAPSPAADGFSADFDRGEAVDANTGEIVEVTREEEPAPAQKGGDSEAEEPAAAAEVATASVTAGPTADEDFDVVDEYRADVFEARTLEDLDAVGKRYADRLNTAPAARQKLAKEIRKKRAAAITDEANEGASS